MADVRDFGATGDGTTDDAGAIEHAIAQGDGALVLPRGTYRLSRTVAIDLRNVGPIALDGSGGTARLVMAGPGPALRFIGTHDQSADPASFRPGVWARERMPRVRDVEIVGEHDQADGIELDGTMQATITGALIRRCRYGVHLVRRNRNLLLADSHIYHGRPGGIGVYFDGVDLHQANVVGCHISYCPHAGIKVQRSQVRNLQVSGCDIEYNHDPDRPDSADVWIDAREGAVREGTITGCTIQAKPSPGGANVRIEGADVEGSKQAGLWTIAGNVLQSQQVNLLLRSCRGVAASGNSFAQGFEHAIVLDKCRHVAVTGCTFDHNPDYSYGADHRDGIVVSGSSGVMLSALILENVRAGDDAAGGAIAVRGSRAVTIAGCQVLDPAHRGIDLADVRQACVSGCTILDRRASPTMREAIRLSGPGRDNLILNNLASRPIVVEPGAATVAGNVAVESPAG